MFASCLTSLCSYRPAGVLQERSCSFGQSSIRKMPDSMSHIITAKIRVKPNSMMIPSRPVNFDRFMSPLSSRKFRKDCLLRGVS